MIRMAALLFTVSASAATDAPLDSDTIFKDGFDAPPPAGSCVSDSRIRLSTSGITYGPFHDISSFNPLRASVDVTEWDQIWGHANATDGVLAWPGRNGTAPALRNFSRTNFVAAHFKTPANATSASTLSGFFTYPIDWNNPNADMKISTSCGDFSANQTNPGCVATNVPSSNEKLVRWKFTPGNTNAYCVLQPDTDYYVNIRLTDPASPVTCAPIPTAGNCPLYIAHNFGGAP